MGNGCLGQCGKATGGFARSCRIIGKGRKKPRTMIERDEKASQRVFFAAF